MSLRAGETPLLLVLMLSGALLLVEGQVSPFFAPQSAPAPAPASPPGGIPDLAALNASANAALLAARNRSQTVPAPAPAPNFFSNFSGLTLQQILNQFNARAPVSRSLIFSGLFGIGIRFRLAPSLFCGGFEASS